MPCAQPGDTYKCIRKGRGETNEHLLVHGVKIFGQYMLATGRPAAILNNILGNVPPVKVFESLSDRLTQCKK